MILMVGGFGGWAATTHLAGAVITPGVVVVESSVKKVQHPTGGVVGELLVKEGDPVEAGQIVVRLDDTLARSTLGVLRSQLDELLAHEARLLAERGDEDEMVVPDELKGRLDEKAVNAAVSGELRLFKSRRDGRAGQRSQYRERIGQSKEEIVGLTALQESKEREIGFIAEELVGVSALREKNLVSITRLKLLQRDKVTARGREGSIHRGSGAGTGKDKRN
jgi:HlyD family secretion protein